MADNPKKDHHFIPRFHIARWCQENGKFFVYRKYGDGRIVEQERFPTQVGYREYLYSLVKGFDPREFRENHDEIEDHLGRIDEAAARASLKMIQCGASSLTDTEKLDWAKYVVSLTIRTPEHLKEIRAWYINHANSILGDGFWESDNWEDVPMKGHILSMVHNDTLHEMYKEIVSGKVAADICKYTWAIAESFSDEIFFILSPDPVWRNRLPDGYTHTFGIPLTPKKFWIAIRSDWKDSELLQHYTLGYNLYQAEKLPEFIISSEPLVTKNTYRWENILEAALKNSRHVDTEATVRSWAADFLPKLDIDIREKG